VTIKMLVSVGMVLGALSVGSALANANPNPNETHPDPFGALTCDCQGTPQSGAGAQTEMQRGMWTAIAQRAKPLQES
jgi:hypothetical protein